MYWRDMDLNECSDFLRDSHEKPCHEKLYGSMPPVRLEKTDRQIINSVIKEMKDTLHPEGR